MNSFLIKVINNMKLNMEKILSVKIFSQQKNIKIENRRALNFKLLLIFFLNISFFIQSSKTKEILSGNEYIFLVCVFGKKIIKSNHRIKKYFYVLDKFVPQAKVIFAISKYTIIEHSLLHSKNIHISVERYRNETAKKKIF